MPFTKRARRPVAGLLLTAATAAGAQSRIVFTSRVQGRLAEPACEGASTLVPSRFSSAVAPSLLRAASAGALLVDTGGLLSVHGVARFAAERAPDALAALVASLGYRALALSVSDLAAPRGPSIEVWRALKRQRIAVVANNLRCLPPANASCEALSGTGGDPVLLEAGEERVALVGVLPADALRSVASEQSAGLSVEDPSLAIAGAVRRARELGATMIVASVDGSRAGDAASYAMDLARSLPSDARPDVLLAARAGDRVLFARIPEVKPAIVAARPGTAVDLSVRRLQNGDLDLIARPLRDSSDPSPPVDSFVERVGPAYCAEWGRALAGGNLSRPMDGEELLRLAAGALRVEAHAEVAILNRGAIDSTFVVDPPRALTASDLYVALPYDDELEVGRATGEWLSSVAKSARARGLFVLGLSDDGESIAGRPLDPRARYRVATVSFLASGGDAALSAGPRWEPVRGRNLRSILLDRLARPSNEDPRDAIPDPAEAAAWTVRPDLDARVSSSSISNPGAYAAAPLQRADSAAANIEANLRANADVPSWLWENAALVRFRSSRTSSADPAVPEATDRDDLESLRSTITFRTLFGPKRWYVPQPYAEAYGETESASTNGTGGRRWLGRGSLGLRLEPTAQLSLKVAGAVERQIDTSGARSLAGMNAQLVLTPWDLARFGERRIELDSTVDAFAGGATAQVTLRGHAGLTVDLVGPLALSFAVDLYSERDGGGPYGIALDTSAGLRVRLLERWSTF